MNVKELFTKPRKRSRKFYRESYECQTHKYVINVMYPFLSVKLDYDAEKLLSVLKNAIHYFKALHSNFLSDWLWFEPLKLERRNQKWTHTTIFSSKDDSCSSNSFIHCSTSLSWSTIFCSTSSAFEFGDVYWMFDDTSGTAYLVKKEFRPHAAPLILLYPCYVSKNFLLT